MNLYPPIIESSLPAFPASKGCIIPYKISQYNSPEDAKNVQVSIVYQDSGRTALNTSLYPNEIIFANRSSDSNAISISNAALDGGWKVGKIYKVQLRFGLDAVPSSSPSSSWISQQIVNNKFSEWSTVCLLKVTGNVELEIMGFEKNATNYVSTQAYNFQGQYKNSDNSESELQYQFLLYNKDTEALLEKSDIKYHISAAQDSHIFKTLLEDDKFYTIEYKIITKNEYEQSIYYDFEVVADSLDQINVTIEPVVYAEEGYIDVNIQGGNYIGNFVLRRTDSKSAYKIWEDYKYFVLENKVIDIHEKDFLVENGIIYKYAIQKINKNKMRGVMTISNPVLCNFNYAYLYADGIQLKLQLDTQVSSFKTNLYRTKQDAIGNQYPLFFENGNVSYKTFPLNGLISIVEDEQELFIKKNQLYNEDENAQVLADYQSLYDENKQSNEIYFLEKKFRENVEKWLNNGKPKLFKSLTEGNIIVNLLDVSLSPKEELYRLLYTFSSNAYEISENTFDNFNKLNLHSIGDYELVDSAVWYEIGQIRGPLKGLYKIDKSTGIISVNSIAPGDIYPYTNIRQEIEEQRNIINEDDEYRQVVDKVVAIHIEGAPALKLYLSNDNGNSQEFTTNLKGIYDISINDNINITELYFRYDQDDVIINYICQMKIEENEQKVLRSSKLEKYWGQLHGFFNPDIKLYNKEIIDNIYTNLYGNNIYLNLDIKDMILNKIFSQDITNIGMNENFKFVDISYLYIECDEGVTMEINGKDIYIGPTQSYELRNVSITSLKFKTPVHALVNYICRVQKEVYNE